MPVKRKYLGFVLVNKIYMGAKTVNWVIDKEQGRKLAQLISKASDEANTFDLKVSRKARKNNKFTLTVTFL